MVDRLDPADLVIIYLLGVVVIALFYGRWPSVLATFTNVASFNIFFIAHADWLRRFRRPVPAYLCMMLTVGLVIGNLTAGVVVGHG
ncbi:DUF4118 domain-containing protein [Shigella flexneri]